jgi:branched-chain amino acid transport system substrate-binding protein
MNIVAIAAGAAIVLAAATAAAQELRVGFLNTTTGPGAIIGRHMENGWKLGLEHQGWMRDGDKLGGVPTKVVYGDDQQKVEVGLAETDKMIKSAKVHLIAGNIWSNVMMAVQKPAIDAKVGLISTNAGPSPLAGSACSPYFVSTSWNNDQMPEAMGKVLTDAPIARIWLMAPNYQAGKDALAGFERTYKGKGKIVDRTLFKVGESDFQADISKLRAGNADAVFLFAPGAMGVAFMKQWAASGAGRQIKLYDVFTVNWVTLPPIGEAAVGSYHTNFWDAESPDPANQKFVKGYMAKFGHMPSHFAAQSYDAAALIAAAVSKVGGKTDDVLGLMKAMRKTEFASVRGKFAYNVNGMPIQNFYLREVVKGADGKPTIKTTHTVFTAHKDSYWEQCPAAMRY